MFDDFIQYEALGYSEGKPECIGVPSYTLSTLAQHKPGSKEPLGIIGSLAVVRVKSINKEIPKSTFELRFKENQTVLKFDPATLKTTVYHCQNGKLIPVDNVRQMQAYEQQSVRSGNRVFSVLLGGGALVAVVVALAVYGAQRGRKAPVSIGPHARFSLPSRCDLVRRTASPSYATKRSTVWLTSNGRG